MKLATRVIKNNEQHIRSWSKILTRKLISSVNTIKRHFFAGVFKKRESSIKVLEEHSFKCSICGNNKFQIEKGVSIREAKCKECGASKRNSDIALAILKVFGLSDKSFLMKDFFFLKNCSIYEVQSYGAIHEILSVLPHYLCSEYFEDLFPGEIHHSGIRCENLERLSFAENSFDLVISQDVLEHVSDPDKAFKEIHRVLKPGGCHLFTVPIHEGKKTIKRAKAKDKKVINLLPPVYHGNPVKEITEYLVFTDWGDDIIEYLDSLGFPTQIIVSSKFYPNVSIPYIDNELEYKKYEKASKNI